jgi:hypothetical protein
MYSSQKERRRIVYMTVLVKGGKKARLQAAELENLNARQAQHWCPVHRPAPPIAATDQNLQKEKGRHQLEDGGALECALPSALWHGPRARQLEGRRRIRLAACGRCERTPAVALTCLPAQSSFFSFLIPVPICRDPAEVCRVLPRRQTICGSARRGRCSGRTR